MRKSTVIVVVAALVVLALAGGGVWWYVSVPHTAESQFAYAEKLEKELRAQSATKTAAELGPKIEETVEQYQRVGTRFGKGPKTAESLKRIAKIYEEVAKDGKKALAALEQLGRDYPDEDDAGYALIEEAHLIRAEADALKASGKPEALQRYKDALAKLEEFRKTYDKSKAGDSALMEIGRIWQDGIEEPPIHCIETFEQVLKDYPHSEFEPEALFRLAQEYARINQFDRALALYSQLLEEYPKSKFAADATIARGRLLADKMDKHDEAAKDFEKMAQQFPDDPRAQSAGQDARSEKTKAAEDEGRKYGESRYGGSVPLDTSDDKPLPPAEMLKQFIAEKLDAEMYDLNVGLEPAEHRITVNGTLKLVNRGEDKKEMLLMLAPGLKVSAMTVDGVVAETKHSGPTLKVVLPAELKKDGETTLGFTYTGQYADAAMMKDYKPGPGGGSKGSKPALPPGAGDPTGLKGKPAPNIELKTIEGKDVSLADMKGKVVLVDTWATWCPPCRESLPHLQRVSADPALAAKGLVVWGVNDQEAKADVDKFMTENKYTFTVPMDGAGTVMKDFSVSGIPTTFIVGRDGVVKEVYVGWGGEASGKEMDEAIEKALAEAAPAPGNAAKAIAAGSTPTSAPAAAESKPDYAFDPQMGLGDYGYGLSGAMWYPTTIIGDVFDAHVTITTPANMEAVANGEVVKREKSTVAGKPGRFEFRTKVPVFGLYFGYGDYVVQEKQVGDIHFYSYFHADHASKHEAYVEVMNRILTFYGSKFVPFPYEKMAVIEAPLPPFLGGVGPASLMFLQEDKVAHPEVPETLLAHELAHQWFGNLIPINLTDPGYSQWLSEGFATYCDALYTEHKDGHEAFGVHIQRYQQFYFQLSMMVRPTSIRDTMSPASPLYRPVVYEKGALVLHMLRKVIGDEKFFRLMRQYVETYRNKLTTTDDFRRMAGEVAGEDLSWFFAEWYDRTVFAHYKVMADVTAGAGGASTKVTITQPDELVKMPADVTLIGANGERQVEANVMLDKKENILEAKTPFVPVKVIVDEENWVLKRPGTDNIWTSVKVAVK